MADETGLGKTHVAREVISLTVEHLQRVDHVSRIDIVYVCSNADIAHQNIRKLNISGSGNPSFATRLSLLIKRPELLSPSEHRDGKPITFAAFTPATSFKLGWQMGKAEERAVLYLILCNHLELRGAQATAAQRVFQGAVSSRQGFLDSYVAPIRGQRLEPNILRVFLEQFDRSCERSSLISLIDAVVGRRALTDSQRDEARSTVGVLRRMLSQAAVAALQPDLVILDEFQRFRELLDVESGSEAAELANALFTHPDARVLLLSATPYKPFTYADEAAPGESHYEDFVKTLKFLAASDRAVGAVRADLDALRQAALSGEPTAEIRDRVQSRLRRWIARTERPTGTRYSTQIDTTIGSREVRAGDFEGYVALRRLADEVQAPFSVEYWKSSPYFINFLRDYRVGEHLRAALKTGKGSDRLRPLLLDTQRIAKSDVDESRQLEWANARLRSLAEETLGQGWWRLLWMPPSLPYHSLGGPYESVDSVAITKQLIFSSWVAAPTAIASLLSYEVWRLISAGDRNLANTPGARAAISNRLDYRMVDERPASMSVLTLFWPQPALASLTDPLDAARESSDLLSVEELLKWATDRVEGIVQRDGNTNASASAAWYWFAPMSAELGGGLASVFVEVPPRDLVEALAGASAAAEPEDERRALHAHVEQMLGALANRPPVPDRPTDLRATSALLGLGGPGNIAWRALKRLSRAGDRVTELGRWRAAATLASGLRSLFARPDAMLLIDRVYGNRGGARAGDDAYWRRVARYCIDGGLQAVLDEYVHHLAGESGVDTTTDEGLALLAETARRAIALRGSVYRATDVDQFEGEGIAFPSRYALRFGSTRHSQDDARLPEVRAAFNSPFWPFVLATTSVGQEGIDFHWWCHSVVHWNLPANPVDFEQREGRVDRYKGHAIRKNVAAAHRQAALAQEVTDPWTAVFEAAASEDKNGLGDLIPYWMYPGDAHLLRRVLALPLSRDQKRWNQLQDSLALYRLAFGQPRQEDMLAALQRRGIVEQPERIAEIRIDLRPPKLVRSPRAARVAG